MRKVIPQFCGIGFDSKAIVVGNLIEDRYDGFCGPTITCENVVEPPYRTFKIIGADSDGECVDPCSIAVSMPDMPDGCFMALNEHGLCGSMYAEGDRSGIMIYALACHDGGIKSKVVYSSFHEDGYTNDLKKYTPYTAKDLKSKVFYGQYTGVESVRKLLVRLGSTKDVQ